MIFTIIASSLSANAAVEYSRGRRYSRFYNNWRTYIYKIDVDGDNLILYKRKGEYEYAQDKKFYHYQYYLLGKNARVNSIKRFYNADSISTYLDGDNLYPANFNTYSKQAFQNAIAFDMNYLLDTSAYTVISQSREYYNILNSEMPIDNLTSIPERFIATGNNCVLGVPERFMISRPTGFTSGCPLFGQQALYQSDTAQFLLRHYRGNTLETTETFISQDDLTTLKFSPIVSGSPSGMSGAFLFNQRTGDITIDGLTFSSDDKYITAWDLVNCLPSPTLCDTFISPFNSYGFTGNDFRNLGNYNRTITSMQYLESYPTNIDIFGLGISTTAFDVNNPLIPLENAFIMGIPISERIDEIEEYVQTGNLPSDAFTIETDDDGIPTSWTGKDPSAQGEDGKQSVRVDDMELPSPTRGALTAGACRYYLMTKEAMETFLHWFWYENHGLEDVFDNFWSNMYGNLKETILSYQYFPCTTSALGTISSAQENILLGRLVSTQTASRLNGLPSTILLGSINIKNAYKHFNTFVDWEGYTNFQIYLPFAGIIKLPTKSVQNAVLKVYYCVDVGTGQMNYIIKSYPNGGENGFVVLETTTPIGETIPISLMDDMENKTKLAQTAVEVVGSTIGLAASVATGNIAGAAIATGGLVSGAANASNAANPNIMIRAAEHGVQRTISGVGQIANEAMQYQSDTPSAVGQITGLMGKWSPLKCYLIIDYPTVDNAGGGFNRHVGYLNYKPYKLSSLSGFTTCVKPQIDFTQTAPLLKEIEELYQLMESGIIL